MDLKNFRLNKLQNASSVKSPYPLYIQVRDLVLQMILQKDWEPGEKIPGDRTLSAMLGVSHITLGKAFNMLREEGYLVRYPGHGTFVSDKLPQQNQIHIKKKNVALILDSVSQETFMADLFVTIFKMLNEHGLTLKLFDSINSPSRQFEQLSQIINDTDNVGAIVWPIMDTGQSQVLMQQCPSSFPIVFLDHYPAGCLADWSGYDDYSAGWPLGNAMKVLGFSRWLGISGSRARKVMWSTENRRIQGFRDAFGVDPVDLIDVDDLHVLHDHHELKQDLLKIARAEGHLATLVTTDVLAKVIAALQADNNLLYRHLALAYPHTAWEIDAVHVDMGCNVMAANAVNILFQRLRGSRSPQITLEAPAMLNHDSVKKARIRYPLSSFR